MPNKDALTAQDVALLLKIAKNTVYELVKRKELGYYKVGRKLRFSMADVEKYIELRRSSSPIDHRNDISPVHASFKGSGFIICGQDSILDVLAANLAGNQHLDRPPLRAYVGSYRGLTALYQGEVHAATSHLWDGDSGKYNVPFVRRLLPGIPCAIFHLTLRTQGLYVAQGNPKGIKGWEDFNRPDLVMVNREKGAGSRVLLDEHLRLMNLPGGNIKGYAREELNHLSVAGAVGRKEADMGVGDMKAASQVEGVDFIPLQQEEYVLVLKKEDLSLQIVQAILEILNSKDFMEQFRHMKGYDISSIGKLVGET
ncbi:MAG: helix-turn-helix transcriptional regulator [Deltaproteobacteria bacterium]|jgi:putative molybdopterin biosynthesis protein|nr:helix-turn-helix transcriptional regulator [Deltaproteobacteria bacterium]